MDCSSQTDVNKALPKKRNLRSIKAGDLWLGFVLRITRNGDPVDLTGANVLLEFFKGSRTALTLSSNVLGEITVLDNQVTVNSRTLALPAYNYSYTFSVIYPSQGKRTYMEGYFFIK